MRLRVIDCGEVIPLVSHAVPYGIAAAMAADADPVLTLATPQSPYVSIGVHQDIAADIDADYCLSQGLPVLRRETGGGTVLIDRDQLYFHFIVPRRSFSGRSERLFSFFMQPVLRTYADLGIVACRRGINDIQVDDRKLGATAAAEIGAAVVVAGSFLFDFDRETMARCLRVPDDAFRELLRQGLADHMTTMRQLLPEPPARERVKARFLLQASAALGGESTEDALTSAESLAVGAAEIRHAGDDWIKGASRKRPFQAVKIADGVHLFESARQTAGGLLRVRLLEKDRRIARLGLSGGIACLPADGLARLGQYLAGRRLDPEYSLRASVHEALAGLGLDLPGVTADDLIEAIRAARAPV